MSKLQQIESLRIIRRKGTSEDPFIPIEEVLEATNSKVLLSEIPDQFIKVQVKDESGSRLYETKSQYPKENEFYVNYKNGEVLFHQSKNDKKLTFIYTGTGIILIDSSRTWHENDTVKNKLNSIQGQINQLVIDGDSSPEAAQARVDTKGTEHYVLKERLDSDYLDLDSKISDHKSTLESHKLKLSDHNEKINKHESQINTHENTLREHTSELNNHAEKLVEHANELQNHSAQLAQEEQRTFKKSLVNHKQTKGYFVIVDDDGSGDVYTKLKPLAEDYNIPITCAIVPTFIENGQSAGSAFNGPALTLEQMYELQRDLNFEFVSHTWSHPRLAELTDSEIYRELKLSLDWLQEKGFNGRTAIVYPYGSHNDRVMKIARTMYESGIAVDSGFGKAVFPPLDTYRIRRVFDTYGVEKAKNEIDKAKENNGLVIWGTHCWYDTWSETNTREIIEYALSNGLEVVTLSKALQEFGNLIEIPNDDVPILVGADGKGNIRQTVILDKFDEHTIENSLEDFSYRYITVTPITYQESQKEGYPVHQGGLLITYRVADSPYANYQVFEPIQVNSTKGWANKQRFIRYWVNNAWTEFLGVEKELTLQNEWSGTLKCKKNELNQVHLYGTITAGITTAGTIIGQLPENYRPNVITPVVAYNATDLETQIGIFISNTGNISIRLPATTVMDSGETIHINATFQV